MERQWTKVVYLAKDVFTSADEVSSLTPVGLLSYFYTMMRDSSLTSYTTIHTN